VAQLAAAVPAAYVVFDLLARRSTDLRDKPNTTRRHRLEKLLATHGVPPGLVLTPTTTDPTVARSWLTGYPRSRIEGVVAKRLDQPYRPGTRGWQKLRTRLTAEAVIAGVLGPAHAPQVLLLGRPDPAEIRSTPGASAACRRWVTAASKPSAPTAASAAASAHRPAHCAASGPPARDQWYAARAATSSGGAPATARSTSASATRRCRRDRSPIEVPSTNDSRDRDRPAPHCGAAVPAPHRRRPHRWWREVGSTPRSTSSSRRPGHLGAGPPALLRRM
jgi:hypothetical protein